MPKVLKKRREVIGMKIMPWARAMRCLVFLTVFLIASSVSAQQPGAGSEKKEETSKFYKGKIITFIVGSRAGGSYDTVGRILSEYLIKYTGATVIVKNVEGGGGIQGANTIYNSKPDGLTIGIVSAGMMQAQTLEGKGVKFDLKKLTWLGRTLTTPDCAVASAKSKLKTAEDLISAKSFKEGNAGAGSIGYLKSVLRSEAVGWNAEMVSGYANTSEMLLALIRGEVDVVSTTWDTIEPFAKSKEVVPLYAEGPTPITGFPEIRILTEIPAVKNRLSERGKDLLYLNAQIGADGLGRMVAASPGIPSDRAAYLEEVIQKKILADPDFISRLQKGNQYTVSPLSGSDTLKEIQRLIGIIEKYRSVIEEGLKKRQR